MVYYVLMIGSYQLTTYLSQLHRPLKNSVKGENGRVLVIGGSQLFHAASFWAASMASHLVDMVHFSSPTMENNDLMRVRAKEKFWDGIVVPYEEINRYIEEDDCIVIGPGMERGPETQTIVNDLLRRYPHKKWVVDGGALQEVDPTLLTKNMIVTPNQKELQILEQKLGDKFNHLSATILSKGPIDSISQGSKTVSIPGGNPGMTKGGTGDVLAGLVAALAAKSDSFTACVIASHINKKAAEELSKTVGPNFSPNDLIVQIPLSIHELTSTP